MTDTDFIEQRLRRTFQVVAEQPIAPLGDAEPWRNGPGSPPRRRRRMMAGGLAVLVVIGAVALGLAYGPRSARPPAPGTQPGLVGPAGGLRAVFSPARPLSPTEREEAAAAMASRLRALGDKDGTVSTDRGSIVVASPTLTEDQVRLVGKSGAFSIRPVECGAPAYSAPPPTAAPGTTTAPTPLPACEAQYATTASNLDVNPNSGIPTNTIGPDPIFASFPSTQPQDEEPATSVLLPADPAAGAQQYPRFALGAAEFNNSGVASVETQHAEASPGWLINIALTPSGTTEWNAVAQVNFHAYVAFELDGVVLSAPLIEPMVSTFSSFGAQIAITGNFTAAEAKGIAALIGSGPLPVPFNLQSLTHDH